MSIENVIIVLLITLFVLIIRAKIYSVYNKNSFIRDSNRAYKEKLFKKVLENE